jgi:hypothetical protein
LRIQRTAEFSSHLPSSWSDRAEGNVFHLIGAQGICPERGPMTGTVAGYDTAHQQAGIKTSSRYSESVTLPSISKIEP